MMEWETTLRDDSYWTSRKNSLALIVLSSTYKVSFRPHLTSSYLLGYYVYIETSSPRRKGDKAWLVSQTYPAAPNGKCLNFYYHMYGLDINLLHVIVKPIGAPFGISVWNKTGNQGNVWRHGQATVQATGRFQVSFINDCCASMPNSWPLPIYAKFMVQNFLT